MFRSLPVKIVAILSVMVAALLVSGVFSPVQQAAAAPKAAFQFSSPTASTTVGEGDDFFTNVLRDPLDFNNPEDVTDPVGWASQGMSNGVWSGVSSATDANFFVLHPGFDIAAVGVDSRSGQVYQIDPNRYSHLVFKYTANMTTSFIAYWMPQGDPYAHGLGNSNIITMPAGTHILDVDLNGGGGGGLAWNSGQWGGLRFQPGFGNPGVQVQLDWVRLTPANATPSLHTTWNCASCNGSVQFFASLDNNGASNSLLNLASGVSVTAGQYDLPTGKLAPGQYYLAARTADGVITFSANKFTVQASPMIKLTSPSTTSGQDFATTMLGKPWDMTDPSMYQLANIANFSVSNGIGRGNATNGDPAIYLLNTGNGLGNSAINTALYKYLTFDLFLPRPGNSVINVARILWYDTPSRTNTTGDIINWQDYWQHYSLDMSRVKLAANNGGWSGTPNTLRIDPHEWDEPNPLVPYFQISAVKLTADPTVTQGSSTVLRWNTVRGSGNVSFYYDTQKNSTGGTQFASNVPLSDGVYNWNVGNLAAGTYWIRAVTTDGFSTTQWWSDAPLVVSAGVTGLPVVSEPNGLADVANEGDDFFTTALHNPEDFRDADDVTSAVGWTSQGMSNASWTGVSAASDASFFLLNPGLDNQPLSGRGQTTQINPFYYNHLIFRYTASANTNVIVYWMPAGDPYRHGFGNSTIYAMQAGTHILDIDLGDRSGAAGGLPWTSGIWGGLRFQPGFGTPGVQVTLNWVRLTPTNAGPNIHVNWNCRSCLSSSFDIYADDDNNPANGGLGLLLSGVNPGTTQFDVPMGKLNPGTYYLAAVSAGNPIVYSPGKFVVLSASGYADVSQSNPFYNYISDLSTRGVIEGYNDNSFRPYDNATRGTLARWIVKSRGWTYNTTGGPHFTDVPVTNPDYAYIETAYNHGVLSGYDDHTFRPDATLTRGQMSKMVVNAMTWTTNVGNSQHFVDVTNSNPFYAQIETIYSRGLVSGYDAPGGGFEFRWGNTLTRGQLAKVLANALTQ